MGSDVDKLVASGAYTNFNPRFHYGKRHKPEGATSTEYELQSTLPLWEATDGLRDGAVIFDDFNPRFHYGKRQTNRRHQKQCKETSIHASTMGSDSYI